MTISNKVALNDDSILNKEIEKHEKILEQLRNEIVELEIEITDKTQRILLFEAKLNEKFAVLNQELKRIELSIYEYEKRIELIKEKNKQPEKVEEEIKFSFYEEKQKLNNLKDEYERTSQQYHSILEEEEKSAKLSPNEEGELKKLFRKLSLKHHPDKGGDAKVFIQVNEAYRAKDLLKLKDIDENILSADEYGGLTLNKKLERIKKQCILSEKKVIDLKLELQKIHNENAYLLLMKCEKISEVDVLNELYNELKETTDKKAAHLDGLIKEFNNIINSIYN